MPHAFIAYSSKKHVPYINEVLEVVNVVLKDMDIIPFNFSKMIRAREKIPTKLREIITQSDMGIVILDGLRPNVVYEFGLLQTQGLHIIPLKKSDAKLSVKSFFYNPSTKDLDPTLAFGDFRYKDASLRHLKEPLLDINSHLSDCQGEHIIIYETVDDSDVPNSLGKLLRDEIEAILPTLRARDGPDFQRVNDRYRNLNLGLLNQSLRLLSLFSILGWRQNFEGDDKFQHIRNAFVYLFKDKEISIQEINTIFETLLQDDLPILRKHGRYITVDSERIINESFEYFFEHKQEFDRTISLILDSDVEELRIRFFERFSLIDIQRASDHANYYIVRSGSFTEISILQDRGKSLLFSKLAYLSPSEALEKLWNWINPLTLEEIEIMFPFQSTLISPRNPQDSVLWFLSYIAKYEQYFERAMSILTKFSLPLIVQELDLQDQIHPYIHKLALDRFLEQCYSLLGNVDVKTRWNFIKNISWDENWSASYKKATIDLKFRAIERFLVKDWSIPGAVVKGTVRITHFRISDGNTYEDLENCLEESYRILMDWLNQPDLYNNIYDSLFNFLYRNLSDWLRYVPWVEIKIILESIFQTNREKKIVFINHIDNIRRFDTWKSKFSEDDIKNIFRFQDDLESKLSTLDYFKRKLRTSPLINETENILNDLFEYYIGLQNTDKNDITDFLLSVNSYDIFQFGQKFKESFTYEEIKVLIEYCSEYIENNDLEEISEFFIGLWNSFFNLSNDSWMLLVEDYWNKSHMKKYLYRILIGSNDQFDVFRWKKFNELVDTQQVKLMDIIKTLRSKKLPPSVSEEDKRNLLIKSFDRMGEVIKSKEHNLDEIAEYSLHLKATIQKQGNLIDVEVAESFLGNFYPIAVDLISHLFDTDLIFEFGKLASDSFKRWIKSGFYVTNQQESGRGFLEKCFEIFPNQSYEILEQLFTASQNADYRDENFQILDYYKQSGNPKILNHLSEEKINNLYNLNSSILGPLFGRLIRDAHINASFPSTLKQLIINYPEDSNFKKLIFREFSTGVRIFVGNNYDQQYSGDYKKISKWRDSATNQLSKEWLQELHAYIDTLRNERKDVWEELEVQ